MEARKRPHSSAVRLTTVSPADTSAGAALIPQDDQDRTHIGQADALELYPYSLPSPPKSWLFGGLGYGYGVGCSVGPVFGLGVGVSPAGVQFGSGVLPFGVFCGVGLAAGGIVGQGSAYVPYGITSGFFLAPRFVMLEGMAEIYRERMAKRRARSIARRNTRRDRAMDSMWPRVLRERVQGWLRNRGIIRSPGTQDRQIRGPNAVESTETAQRPRDERIYQGL